VGGAEGGAFTPSSRDGNVPGGYEQLRVFKEALGMLPEGVTKSVSTFGYAGISMIFYDTVRKGEPAFWEDRVCRWRDVTREFKKAVAEVEESEWRPLLKRESRGGRKTGAEWAEVCFVPNALAEARTIQSTGIWPSGSS